MNWANKFSRKLTRGTDHAPRHGFKPNLNHRLRSDPARFQSEGTWGGALLSHLRSVVSGFSHIGLGFYYVTV